MAASRAAWGGRLAALAIVLALGCAAAELAGGLGFRAGTWDYRTGLTVVRWSASTEIAAIVLALAALGLSFAGGAPAARRRAVVALLVALAIGAPPFYLWRQVETLPRIHDITTDTDNPPTYAAVLPLRRGLNTLDVVPATLAEQKRAYPDIGPVNLGVPAARASEQALAAVKGAGWEVVAADAPSGRIAATDTSLLFGFKDDVVIRISASSTGSRVDIRSVSRVGRSDFGANARRVRKLAAALAGA